MPRTARPSERWSSVVASFAVWPGLRNVLAPTISPSRTRDVSGAEPGQDAPALEDRLLPRPEDGHEVIPCPDRVPARRRSAARAESRKPGQSVCCAQSWSPKRVIQSARWSWIGDRRDPEADPVLSLEAGAIVRSRLARAPRPGSGGPSRRCRPGVVSRSRDRSDRPVHADPAVAVRGVDDGERDARVAQQVGRPASPEALLMTISSPSSVYQTTAWRGPPSGSTVAMVA